MSEPKSKKNPNYALDTLLWVKLLKRVWWPGTVVDPLTVPQELLEYVKKVEPISCVVKFKEDDKYHVVELYEEVYLYSCDRKMEFIEKGFSLYKSQLKGFAVIGNFDMNNFKNEVISMEQLTGGDIRIFEKLKEKNEKVKSIVKEFFTPSSSKKSKKKEVESRKSLPASKLPKTPNQPKPKPISKPRTSQSQVSKTYKQSKTGYSCHSQIGCNYTTNRYDNLKWHMATHKNDTDVVQTKKASNSSTSNKRKNVKTKSSEVKKQKLQEELLKDWDNDGEDEDEINTSGVQSSCNVVQSSNEEVLQTMIDVQSSSSNVVQSSNDEIVQTMSDVLSSNNVAQSSNEEIVQTKTDLPSSSNVVQSSNEEVIPTSKVLLSKNDAIPIIRKALSINSEDQETSTCSPNKVFDFNENDNNTPVVELRQSRSDCSSTVDDDISETFESRITPDFINNTIFEASPSESVLVEKPHGIQLNELANEIDNQTKSTELLLEKSVDTLDKINNFVVGEPELSACGSLNKTASPCKDINMETNGVGIPLVENISTEKGDSAIDGVNTNDTEIVSNDEEVNQSNGTTIDEIMSIENSSSVEKETLVNSIPKDWFKGTNWKSARSAIEQVLLVNYDESTFIPPIDGQYDDDLVDGGYDGLLQLHVVKQDCSRKFKSDIQEMKSERDFKFGDSRVIYVPKNVGEPCPRMEDLMPNVNPVTADCQRATMENLFIQLNIDNMNIPFFPQ